jgi:hypothetical protein
MQILVKRAGSPSVEVEARRTRVEPTRTADVLSPVGENIDEPQSQLARGSQGPAVVAIAPHATSTPDYAVYHARQTNRKTTRPPRESGAVVSLDQEMYVIGLHGEVNHTKLRIGAASETAPKLEKNELAAKARKASHGA